MASIQAERRRNRGLYHPPPMGLSCNPIRLGCVLTFDAPPTSAHRALRQVLQAAMRGHPKARLQCLPKADPPLSWRTTGLPLPPTYGSAVLRSRDYGRWAWVLGGVPNSAEVRGTKEVPHSSRHDLPPSRWRRIHRPKRGIGV